ncbi:Ecdysteroid UDP-glucosyltransferase [Armadillidium nasatum]|uniref:UDP-glucuronosyltransferase n=1 Tax=Armadillidium nasatum TaxID=96803 RepID=A0A5N5TFX6_9CRUS|nr:Ecdysteroid UDP-glucosyltransferase [Armadillidium nasatum]
MSLIKICLILILSIVYIPHGEGERVLVVTPIGTKSHKIFLMGISEALTKKGHHVTMVSAFEPDKERENIREVIIRNYTVDYLLKKAFEQTGTFTKFYFISTKACIDGLKQEHIQDLKKEKFDVIIMSVFFDYCYFSLIHHFKVPYVYASPLGIVTPYHKMVGNIDVPSISGSLLSEPAFPITFVKRLRTTLSNLMYTILNDYYLEPQMHSQCVKSGLCPADMPLISEIHKNVSLILINSVKTLEKPPRPSMPNVIHSGAAFIKSPKKLPKDLGEWIDASGEEGCIYFSLGSALNPDFLPEEHLKTLLKVFGSLKQRVLWKYNKPTIPDLPKNVKLQKWLPQNDVLGHPKVKLFITHGGLLSTHESVYNGVPVIGMPVFADQYANMAAVELEGFGRLMEWDKLEENIFRDMILEVINSKEYEVYNMDVWASILLVLLLTFYISWRVIKFILRKCFGPKVKGSKRKKE